MKIFMPILLLFLSIFACSKRIETSAARGLISFRSFPDYQNEKLLFKAQIEYSRSGNPLNIEYNIKYDKELVDTGKVFVNFSDNDAHIFFESKLVSVSIPKAKYAGKILTILLDPDLKNTLPIYYGDQYLRYRQEEVAIPK
jgi:hypothetical protein